MVHVFPGKNSHKLVSTTVNSNPVCIFYLRTFLMICRSADRRYLVFSKRARTLEKYNRYLRPSKSKKEISQTRPYRKIRDYHVESRLSNDLAWYD